jgi:hypothetical protein
MEIAFLISKIPTSLNSFSRPTYLNHAFAALALFFLAMPLAIAQSCPVPLQMPTINIPVHIDTCSSAYLPDTFCGGITPTGPAVVFNLYVLYPNSATTLLVEPDDASYDPGFAIESRQCSDLSICPYTIDAAGPGVTEQLNLGGIDSGQYFLVITSFAPTQTCGGATVLLSNPDNVTTDGLFRAGVEY